MFMEYIFMSVVSAILVPTLGHRLEAGAGTFLGHRDRDIA
jgi:hypothetical protein